MRTYLECIPCIVEQTIRIAKEITQDERKRQELLQEVLKLVFLRKLGYFYNEMRHALLRKQFQ